MKKRYAVGVDIGGSHISSVLVDVNSRKVVPGSASEQKINNKASAGEILAGWSETIKTTLSHIPVEELLGIGFAMPGPFDYTSGVSLIKGVEKYDNLYGINVGDKLKKMLSLPEGIPFRYFNDAMSFAMGESWIGTASKFKNVMAITLGTGFGSAFLTNGVPVIEGLRVPEMGYVYNIPYKKGIADDYFSTRWFIKSYKEKSGVSCKGVKEIAEKANSDRIAKTLFDDFGNSLGIFLAPFLNKFTADCLVIGGNISGAWSLFEGYFQKSLTDNNINVEIVISELKETAAMAGSARLLDDIFWYQIKPLTKKI
jgi:glucokinase